MEPTKSLRDHIADFLLLAPIQRSYRPDTVTLYRFRLAKFAAWAEQSLDSRPGAGDNATLADFSPARLREYRNQMLLEYKDQPPTRASINAALRSFALWLVSEERLDTDPTVVLGQVKVKRHSPRVADDACMRNLLAACDRLYNPQKRALSRAVIAVLSYAGLRRSELRALHVTDIVPDPTEPGKTKIIVREGKGGYRREVPICEEAVTAINAWKQIRPLSAFPHLFVQNTMGPLSEAGLYSLLRVVARLADEEYKNPHALRHGYATHLLLQPEIDTKTVSDLLGHRQASTTTNTYYHTTDKRKRKAADRASLNPSPGETPPVEPPLPPLRLISHDESA